MKITMIIADSAQVADRKLYILGGGWSFTGPQVGPMAIAALFEVPWSGKSRYAWKLELQDADGRPVRVAPDDREILLEGNLEVGRPAGHPEGAPINAPIALNFGPLPLPPGERYVWVLSVDGETSPDWQISFNTRAKG